MAQLNIQVSDELKEKLDWISQVTGVSIAGTVRQAIEDKFDEQKVKHDNSREFIRWIRSQNQ